MQQACNINKCASLGSLYDIFDWMTKTNKKTSAKTAAERGELPGIALKYTGTYTETDTWKDLKNVSVVL